jgi:hypothetical protein
MLTGISNEPAVTGSCCCAAVTYTSTTLPTFITCCYCITCRKLSSGPYLVFAHFPVLSLSWSDVSSSLKTTSHSDIAKRGHCKECGNPLYMSYNHEIDNKDIGICIGSIDFVQGEVLEQLPKTHICMVTSRQNLDLEI